MIFGLSHAFHLRRRAVKHAASMIPVLTRRCQMSIANILDKCSNVMHAIANRVLPQDCHLCGAPSVDALLCDSCDRSLQRINPMHCPCCAMPSTCRQICGRCIKRTPNYDATHAALLYEFPADRLILALKHRNRLPMAGFLARKLAAAVASKAESGIRIDLVIPMPLHRQRLTLRGFNQSVEIGRRVAHQLALAFSAETAQRLRNTPSQAELPLARRRANVRGAFACSASLSGKSVAVVDDVMTSGATLDALAGALKRAGAVHVENWVVARTWPRE